MELILGYTRQKNRNVKMRKAFFIAYVVLSLLVFFTGIKSLFSGHGVRVGSPGDIVYCSKSFPSSCTQGSCTQSDRTVGVSCNLINCSAGCEEYKNGKCIKWYYENPVPCTKPSGGGGGGDPSWGNDCDSYWSRIFGECIPKI